MTRLIALPLVLSALAAQPAFASRVGLDPGFSGDGIANYASLDQPLFTLAHLPDASGGSVAVLYGASASAEFCPANRYCLTLVRSLADGTQLPMTPVGPAVNFSLVLAAAADGEGRLVVVGNTLISGFDADMRVARLWADGSPDESFGPGGVRTIPFDIAGVMYDSAEAVAIDGAGRIVIAGQATATADNDYDFAVARLTSNGLLDADFSADGMRLIPFRLDGVTGRANAHAIAIGGDGTITVVGTADDDAGGVRRIGIARMNDNGTLDASLCPIECNYSEAYPAFNAGRRVIFYGEAADLRDTDVDALAIDAAGNFVTAGVAETAAGSAGYLQAFDGTGEWLGETTTDGGWTDSEPRVGSVHFLDPARAGGDVVLTGVTGETRHSFFAQAFHFDLSPVAGWGFTGLDGSAYTWSASGLFDPGDNTVAQTSLASGDRILAGGSFKPSSNSTLYRAHVAQLRIDTSIFGDGFEGSGFIGR